MYLNTSMQNKNSRTVLLDLEHRLERDPPCSLSSAQSQVSGPQASSHRAGQALLLTHKLQDFGCQCKYVTFYHLLRLILSLRKKCRHDLIPAQRIARGISSNELRSGNCPYNFTIDITVSGHAFGPRRLDLSNRCVKTATFNDPFLSLSTIAFSPWQRYRRRWCRGIDRCDRVRRS